MIICSPQLGISPEAILGGEINDREVLKNHAQIGVKVDIILPFGKKHDQIDNWSIYSLPVPFVYPPWTFNFWIFPYLFYIYLKDKFDILKIHSPRFVGPAALFFKIFAPKVKLFVVYHHLENGFISELIDRMLISRCDYVVAVSQNTKEEIIKKYSILQDKVRVIYLNGLDPKCQPLDKSKQLINRYKLNNSNVLVYLGQLIPRKNVRFLLDVIKKLPSDWKLLICGSGSERKKLETDAKLMELGDRVIFAGRISEDEKVAHFNLADIFVCPSRKEGFGIVLIEAMACGKPVLATNLKVFSEIITMGENGYLEELDSEKWVNRILNIKSHSQTKLIKKAAIKAGQFNWKISVKELFSYLQSR